MKSIMRKVRLYLLWSGLVIGAVGLFIGTPLNASPTSIPKPFGINYNVFLPLVGFSIFFLSMFSSWWVDETQENEHEEVGTVIFKSTLKFLGQLVLGLILSVFVGFLFDRD